MIQCTHIEAEEANAELKFGVVVRSRSLWLMGAISYTVFYKSMLTSIVIYSLDGHCSSKVVSSNLNSLLISIYSLIIITSIFIFDFCSLACFVLFSK